MTHGESFSHTWWVRGDAYLDLEAFYDAIFMFQCFKLEPMVLRLSPQRWVVLQESLHDQTRHLVEVKGGCVYLCNVRILPEKRDDWSLETTEDQEHIGGWGEYR